MSNDNNGFPRTTLGRLEQQYSLRSLQMLTMIFKTSELHLSLTRVVERPMSDDDFVDLPDASPSCCVIRLSLQR